jgi:LPXTG-motif cell wall-anchored protein
MKKLIPVIALLIGTYGAFGQGGTVFFQNNTNHFADGRGRFITMPDGATRVLGTNFAAQLLYGTDPGSLTAHTLTAYFRSTLSPGTWSGGGRSLPTGVGGVGTTIWLQVRVWDSGDRTRTFDQARATGGLWGQSEVFSYQQIASVPPGVYDTSMANFEGFSLVPEPSLIGLGLVGIGALFFFLRRRRRA